MNPIVATTLVGSMIVVRQWSRKEMISIDNVLGIVGIGLGLGFLHAMNPELAAVFGWLVVVGIGLFQLGPLLDPIVRATQ